VFFLGTGKVMFFKSSVWVFTHKKSAETAIVETSFYAMVL
jgi:hypothetical protein